MTQRARTADLSLCVPPARDKIDTITTRLPLATYKLGITARALLEQVSGITFKDYETRRRHLRWGSISTAHEKSSKGDSKASPRAGDWSSPL